MNQSIQTLLNQLIPLSQIITLVNRIMPDFIALGAFFLVVGLTIRILKNQDGFVITDIARTTSLCAGMLIVPLFITLGEQAVAMLVKDIVSAVPSMAWLPTPDPGPSDLVLDYSKPFAILGQFVGGTFAPPNGVQLLNPMEDLQYMTRTLAIGACGFIAAITVFIMEALLILQKLIVLFSKPLLVVFISLIGVPATHGTAHNFVRFLCGTLCWPVGWALGHIGTMALLQNLHAPDWTGGLSAIILALGYLAFVGLYMVGMTISAPFLIAKMVTSGSNFAADLMTGSAIGLGAHTSNVLQSGGRVTGAAIGSFGGPVGASIGAGVGESMGGAAAMPVLAMTETAAAINSGHRAVPSSRSRGAADMAVKAIRAHA